MSKIDFEIATLVYKRFIAIKLTDEEVSFLLGKRNKYVFDLLNPTQKDKFKTEQLDILPTILECKIRDLIPNNIKGNETVKISATKKVYPDKITYQYVVLNQNAEQEAKTIVKKIHKGLRSKLHPQVHQLTLKLIQESYFSTPKNALELYLFYKDHISEPFSAVHLQKSLAACLREDGQHGLLTKDTINARYYYKS